MPDPVITKQDEEVLKKAEEIIETAEVQTEKKNPSIKLRWLIIPIISIVFILLVLSTIFAVFNQNSNLIVKGIHIKGIDVSGLTQ